MTVLIVRNWISPLLLYIGTKKFHLSDIFLVFKILLNGVFVVPWYTARYGRYVPIWQRTDTRTVLYQIVHDICPCITRYEVWTGRNDWNPIVIDLYQSITIGFRSMARIDLVQTNWFDHLNHFKGFLNPFHPSFTLFNPSTLSISLTHIFLSFSHLHSLNSIKLWFVDWIKLERLIWED